MLKSALRKIILKNPDTPQDLESEYSAHLEKQIRRMKLIRKAIWFPIFIAVLLLFLFLILNSPGGRPMA